jgi:hypothetical protein
MRSGTRAAQLDQVGTLAVAEAVRAFRVDCDRSSPGTKGRARFLQAFRSCDERWYALDRRCE